MKRRIKCVVCIDKGFMLRDIYNSGSLYEHFYRCDCITGEKYKYIGDLGYRIPSIGDHFDKTEIAKANIERLLSIYGENEVMDLISLTPETNNLIN